MRARYFLEQYSKLNKMIANKEKEAAELRAAATGTTSRFGTERVQTSGNPDKMADAIDKYVTLEKEITADIDRLIDIKKDIIAVLEQLNAKQYELLYTRYVDDLPLKAIAGQKKCSYDSIRAAHRRAIKSVQRILDERNI